MLNQNTRNISPRKLVMSIVLFLVINNSYAQLNTAVQVAVNTNKASAQAQVRIDKYSNQTEDLTSQYRNILNEIESLRAYNKQLDTIVNDQREQITSMNEQMTHLEQTNRGVVPMIIEMVDALGKVVEADIPFKREERRNRVTRLENLLGESGITTGELYRKVTEAYGIEMDYGSTAEAYQGDLPSGKKVDFLRVGRTTLIYQTLNQEASGWWNAKTGKFEDLDNRYNNEIKEAIRIAQKKASINLVGLPVFGAVQSGAK